MTELSGVSYKHHMKTFALKEKRPASAIAGRRPYVHAPFGPVQRTQQARIGSILRATGAQAKLTIGQPNDRYEQEADRVADQVMRMSDADVSQRVDSGTVQPIRIQRLCPQCEEELAQRQPEEDEDEELQAKEQPGRTPQVTPNIESRINGLKGRGQPLDHATRSFFEPRFGRDFSDVRLHTDSAAADTARSIRARAFTLGNNVVMGSGEYHPNSQSGRRLLGHELTHVVQQSGTLSSAQEMVARHPVPEVGMVPERLRGSSPLPYREAVEQVERARLLEPVTELAVNVDMTVPTRDPRADTSRTIDRLGGAWEKANLRYGRTFSFDTSHGSAGAYVTSVDFNMENSRFEYFIASELIERSGRSGDPGERSCWIQIVSRIRRHAREHFIRYRNVVAATRTEIIEELNALPRRSRPLDVPEADLRAYVDALLRCWHARLAYRLWSVTCEWERTDYPAISRDVRCFSGVFPINCGDAPSVPASPLPPVPVRGRP